jgi:hypothetical protein
VALVFALYHWVKRVTPVQAPADAGGLGASHAELERLQEALRRTEA